MVRLTNTQSSVQILHFSPRKLLLFRMQVRQCLCSPNIGSFHILEGEMNIINLVHTHTCTYFFLLLFCYHCHDEVLNVCHETRLQFKFTEYVGIKKINFMKCVLITTLLLIINLHHTQIYNYSMCYSQINYLLLN